MTNDPASVTERTGKRKEREGETDEIVRHVTHTDRHKDRKEGGLTMQKEERDKDQDERQSRRRAGIA